MCLRLRRDWLIRNQISPWDPRLGPARRLARDLLEQGWRRAGQQGLSLEEEQLATIYLQGLEQAFEGPGPTVAESLPPPGKKP